MKNDKETARKLDELLGSLESEARPGGAGISGLAMRALATEDLAWVSGGESYDEYGGTETVQQGLSCDTKYDGVWSA